MISPELQDFYIRWHQKAEEYRNNNLQDYFDRFTTLYVAYNRLYRELAFSIQRKWKHISRNKILSDAFGAKCIVHQYLGTELIFNCFQNEEACRNSVAKIADLIEQNVFAIKLDRLLGTRQRHKDLELLIDLKSNSKTRNVHAILEVIYSIRCNTFHGHKGFNEIQIEILKPVTTLLDKVLCLLYEKMSNDYNL